MPMPSIVWDYFDEFEGGGKCRLCGCVRNRKDKSTSTFWQHLERVHGLDKRQMLTGTVSAVARCGGSGKRSEDMRTSAGDDSPVEKMPKLELADLDQRATEETFKFISELVRQQQHMPSPSGSVQMLESNNHIEEFDRSKASSKVNSPIGINLANVELNMHKNGIASPMSSAIDDKRDFKKMRPVVSIGTSALFNNSLSGLLEISTNPIANLAGNSASPSCSLTSKSPSQLTNSVSKKRMDYLSWDEFFMGAALLAAQRSKDPCTQVGACIVKENIVVGMGYNGMPIGCHDDEMPWGKSEEDPLNNKYLYVCHAEMNAVMNKNSSDISDSTIYTTLFPCSECAKIIIQSRIKRVVYLKDKDAVQMDASKRLFSKAGVAYSKFEPSRSEVVLRF